VEKSLQDYSQKALSAIEAIGLFTIAVATLLAAGIEVVKMIEAGTVGLADILLLFIYLEVFAMIGVYIKCHRLPVRLPIYIAIVALARYLILDMKAMEDWRMLAVSVSILILAATVLLHRFGHVRFPYEDMTSPKYKEQD